MKSESCCSGNTKADKTLGALTDVVNTQTELIGGLVNLLAESAGQFVRGVLQEATAKKTSTCCDIPDPCWMPVEIAEIECRLCAA